MEINYIILKQGVDDNMTHKITIIGLGNYGLDDLPLGIYRFIQQQDCVYARTLAHPVIEALREDIHFETFDDIYEAHQSFEDVYQTIVDRLLELAQQQDVIYAVPGHPYVAETTTMLLLEAEKQRDDVSVNVLGGKSFIDDIFAAVKIDPNDVFTIFDGTNIQPERFNVRTATIITQVYSNMVAADLKITLMERYPDDYHVKIVDGAHGDNAQITELPLYELDRDASYFNNLTSVFVPAVEDERVLYSDFDFAVQTIDTLVDDDHGCPWDKAQTHASLKRYLLEETFELFEAIDNKDDWHMIEELGDILLQVLLHTSIGKKEGYMDIREVIDGLNAKMIRRHPHIFGEQHAETIDDLNTIWLEAKQQEGKTPRVKFEKVFADHFMSLYDKTKNKDFDENMLKAYLQQGEAES